MTVFRFGTLTTSPQLTQRVCCAESAADREVSAVIFDLDDTLWPVLPALQRATELFLGRIAQHLPNTAARGE